MAMVTSGQRVLPSSSRNQMQVDTPQAQENILAVAFHNTLLSVAAQMNTTHLTFKQACEETQRQVKVLFDDGAEKLKKANTPSEYREWAEVLQLSKGLTNAPLDQVANALEKAGKINSEAQSQGNEIVTKALRARASMIETTVKAEIERMMAETDQQKEMQAMALAKQQADMAKVEFEANQNRMNQEQKNANLQAQFGALMDAYNAELAIAKKILERKGKSCEIESTPPRIEGDTVIPGTVKAESSNCVVM